MPVTSTLRGSVVKILNWRVLNEMLDVTEHSVLNLSPSILKALSASSDQRVESFFVLCIKVYIKGLACPFPNG